MRKALTLTIVCICLSFSLLACATKIGSPAPATFSVHFVGTSMYPTIENNQMGTMQPYASDETPRRGDIIDFVAPPEPTKYYCKRIIGIPGDIITIDGNTVTLNGVTLVEPYVAYPGNPSPYQHIFAVVPPNDYFVIGDNRSVSYDSRFWNFVPRKNIAGRLIDLYGSLDNTHPVINESGVYAQAASRHVQGMFLTGSYSGYYITGNAAFLLFLPSSSFPVFFASLRRKRRQKMVVLIRQSTLHLKRMRNTWYQMGSLVLTVVAMLLFCSCGILPQASHKQPDPLIPPITASYQPSRILQFCVDTKPLFPDTLFRAAVSSVSDMLDSSVNVNEGQIQVYISYITSRSYLNDAFSFSVLAIAADPQQPTLKPLPTPGDDPYKTADQLNKVKIANAQILAAWQAQVKSNHEKLAVIRAQVKQYANRLRSLPNVNDATGEDVAGCLQSATERFSGSGVVNARKTLILASPLLNMVSADNSINLSGVSVVVIMKTCAFASADACIASVSAWKQRLLSFGASNVTILDPQQSLVEKLTF